MLSNLPHSLVVFFSAAQRRDADALSGCFSEGAVLEGPLQLPIGEAISRWCAVPCGANGLTLHPINAERRGDLWVVTILTRGDPSLLGLTRPAQVDLSFKMRAGKVVTLTLSLPRRFEADPTVVDFIEALNGGDVEALVGIFTDDAMVNDQLEEFWGTNAVREWATNTVLVERLTMYVTRIHRHHECVIVRANVDGTFDKRELPDPLALSFYFFVRNARVVQLVLLHNQRERLD